jgi:hypothetical protein
MNDITKHWRFQRILREAAEYRALRRMLLEAARRPADEDDATINLTPHEFRWLLQPASPHYSIHPWGDNEMRANPRGDWRAG